MDKVNKLGLNTRAVQNDLQKESSKKIPQQSTEQVEVQSSPTYNPLDPDTVLDVMKQQGLYQYTNNILKGGVESKSIKESIQQFAELVPPEKHKQMQEKVANTFKSQFPNITPDPDLLNEVVDNLIIESLMST